MRTEICMEDPVFQPGVAKVAQMSISIAPAGLNCTVEAFLTADGTTKSVTTGALAFTSTSAAQNVSLPITMPATGGLQYSVYIDIYVEGTLYGQYIGSEYVIIPGVSDPTITW